MACAEGAAMNVMINLGSIEDAEFKAARRKTVLEDLEHVKSAVAPVLALVKSSLESASA
jgi:formiminotetrahydrofolate cyclodeaminase